MNAPAAARTAATAPEILRRALRICGVVQGVGFRPFIYTLAQRHALAGFVGNDSSGVFIEVEGSAAALAAFERAVLAEAPPLARIDSLHAEARPPLGETGFRIVESAAQPDALTLISPDLALCDECLRELLDPADRRYRYPFINCTHCGPRFTITRGLPYDRPQTTMRDFALCPACAAEYHDPRDRRFHAQPIACPECGPQLALTDAAGHLLARREEALQAALQALAAGQIVAIKGLGGYHLACAADDEAAVARLRQRKQRPHKPLAVMLRDLEQARQMAKISPAEAALLTSRQRPIVLLRRREAAPLAAGIAPDNPDLGLMLPYTPLHVLLLDPGRPLVMTSGNLSEEPIAHDDEDARQRLGAVADLFLTHDRPIHVPCDDSVVRVAAARELPLRRSRGYAPLPLRLPQAGPPLLAVGGELKNTFCLTRGDYAFMGQHIGDMANLETLAAFERAVAHMQAIFGVQSQALVCDQHPGYLSTRWAEATAAAQDLPLLRVQHHHAHIAACMAEHGLPGDAPVLGFSFDGTGYGSDGAIWGGEVLLADYAHFERVAHLRYAPLPGGDAAIQRPYRYALALLMQHSLPWDEALPPVQAASAEERRILARQIERSLNSVPTSSMGRLFDAIAALIGLRQIASYEAQPAIELEALAQRGLNDDAPGYSFELRGAEIDPGPLLRALLDDLRAGVAPEKIAARFHRGVAQMMLEVAAAQRAARHVNTIALSGGVFQNGLLLSLCQAGLQAHGFVVLSHQRVPANDGGLALGQALIGAALLQN